MPPNKRPSDHGGPLDEIVLITFSLPPSIPLASQGVDSRPDLVGVITRLLYVLLVVLAIGTVGLSIRRPCCRGGVKRCPSHTMSFIR